MKHKELLPDIHDSLDAPIAVWAKVHETNDFTYLMVKREKKVSKKIMDLLQKAWEKMYDEYVKEFGWAEGFLALKKQELHVALMKLEYLITGDRSMLTFIETEEQELKEMQTEVGKTGFMQCKIAIETRLKFQINMFTTSIKEFYSYNKYVK